MACLSPYREEKLNRLNLIINLFMLISSPYREEKLTRLNFI